MVGLRDTKTIGAVVLAISVLTYLNGCSISNSAGSTSDSAGSLAKSSESISDSSTSSSDDEVNEKQTDDNRYGNEIQDFTVTYLRSNTAYFNKHAFMKGVSDIAAQHGIVDWEANPKTYRAIGKGLRKARVAGVTYDAYKKQLSNGDVSKMDDLQEGYDD